jgi:hypothetical protein
LLIITSPAGALEKFVAEATAALADNAVNFSAVAAKHGLEWFDDRVFSGLPEANGQADPLRDPGALPLYVFEILGGRSAVIEKRVLEDDTEAVRHARKIIRDMAEEHRTAESSLLVTHAMRTVAVIPILEGGEKN